MIFLKIILKDNLDGILNFFLKYAFKINLSQITISETTSQVRSSGPIRNNFKKW
jgi:hypothetical protein